MRWARIGALAGRIIIQFRRDRRTLALLIIVPIVILSLVAYLIELEAKDIPLGVVNEDLGATTPQGMLFIASDLVEVLEEGQTFRVVEVSREGVEAMIESGELKGAIIFPEDFTAQWLSHHHTTFNLTLEGSNPQTAATILSGVSKAVSEVLAGLICPDGEAVASPIEINTSYVYGGEHFNTLDYAAPVIISLFAFFFVFLLTSISFLRERAQGTMERLMASPLRRREIVLGYMLGFSVFAFIQSLVILLFAIFVLRIHYVGNPLVLFLVVMILTIGSVNLGIFLSTFARNELQVVQFIPLVLLPQVLLCGVIWAIEDMPLVFQWIAHALPLTYANFALREVMIKGYGLTEGTVGINILILVFFAALMILLGALTLRREIA